MKQVVSPENSSSKPYQTNSEVVVTGGMITDGYASGKKIHMVGGSNAGKAYAGFILNIRKKTEDEMVLRGNFLAAATIYRKLDAQGDLTAAHNLGLMLIRGLDGPKDIKLGMTYLERSMADPANYATAKSYYDRSLKVLSSGK